MFTQISWGQLACASFPCYNGGICTNTANSFNCVCQPFFTGPQCQDNDGDPSVLRLIAPFVNEKDTNVVIDDSINLFPIEEVNVTTTFTITGAASVTFDIEAETLATVDLNFVNSITLYPIPSSSILNIKNTSNSVISTIEIIDVFW